MILSNYCLNAFGGEKPDIPPEVELGRKVFEEIKQHIDFMENPIILKYVEQIGLRILDVLPPNKFEFRFYPIISNDINAFALSNGYIFLTNGLIQACDSEEELAFVISHEISHVLQGHLMKFISQKKKIDLATVAIMILGVLISKDADLQEGIPALSIGMNQNITLSYSRDQENEADTYGFRYLEEAGYNTEGAIKFMEKLRLLSQITITIPTYLSTHPVAINRLLNIKQLKPRLTASQTPSSYSYNFKRIKLLARLETDLSLRILADLTPLYLEDPNNIDVVYGLALVKERSGISEEAEKYYKEGLRLRPEDVDILRDYALFLYRRGRIDEAEDKLKKVTRINPKDFIAYHYIGRIMMDQNLPDKAIEAFMQSVKIFSEFQDNYHFLGIVYNQKGMEEKSHEYFEKYFTVIGNQRAAEIHATKKKKMKKKEVE